MYMDREKRKEVSDTEILELSRIYSQLHGSKRELILAGANLLLASQKAENDELNDANLERVPVENL
jgi:hypothetical protein